MAAPAYSTDLIDLAIGSITVDAGSWDESSDAAWDDAGAMVDDGNLYYNGIKCVSAQFTKDGVGTIMYEHTGSVTIPTDGAMLIHHLWAAPPALALEADGGIRILIGNGFGVFYAWKASGSDAPPAPSGGWYQYAVNPAIGSPDYTVGSPATPYNTFGMAVSATAQARGNPNACNAVRYGRCEAIYTIGDLSTPATFAGYAALDNASSAKWGLLKNVEGGYKQQGLQSYGTSSTAVYFEDENINIVIEDTKNTTANFNRYEVVNSGSTLKWTAVSISALGTTSKGRFVVVDNATVEKTSCTFTDMDYFTYQSNSTILTSIYRRCGVVTQGNATFTSCTFDDSSAMIVNNLGVITDCKFISGGTGHGLNLGTISSTQSMSWGSTDSGYTDASSGNEAILVSVDNGVTLTINVAAGASTPSVYNTGTGTVSIVAGVATLLVTCKDQGLLTAIEGSAVTILVGATGSLPYNESVAITSTGGVATVAHTGHGMATGNKVKIDDANENEYNRIKTITVTTADEYTYPVAGLPSSPATGAITATAVLIDALTNASGEVSDSRVHPTDQSFSGKARKGSTSPVYVPAPTSGIIDTTAGATVNLLMIPD